MDRITAQGTEPRYVLEAGTLITMDTDRGVIEDAALVIDDHKIADIGSRRVVWDRLEAAEEGSGPPMPVLNARDSIVMPGLVSCHTHLFQTLFRGLADDMTVEDWFLRMVLPMSRHLGEEESFVAAQLAIVEMIRTGTTCFADSHYIHVDKRAMDGVARAVKESGIRGLLVRATQNRNVPEDFVEDVDTACEESERCIRAYNGTEDDRIRLCPEALSLIEADDTMVRALHEVGLSNGVGFHMHVAESQQEMADVRAEYGEGCVEHLKTLGVLGPQSLLAHCVWVSPEEIHLLATSGTFVAHNPVSNMFLADGIAPIPAMLQSGVPVGIGVDGAASNNSQDMFEAMKMSVLQQRVGTRDPRCMDAETALEMATLGSASALRWQESIGSLEPGKRADVVICPANDAAFTPGFKPISDLVFSASGRNVATVIVDGRVLMRDRRLTTIDENAVLENARETAFRMLRQAGCEGLARNRWSRAPETETMAGGNQ
jgi:5-methylthioadenosine/S-adenosylhomocysteine deaminase